MSRPIKVPEDLFLALSQVAEEGGITMQQALQNRLASHQQQVQALGAERTRLKRALENRDKTLLMAQEETSREQSTLRGLCKEREELIKVIEEADEEHSQLSAELAIIRDAFESTSSELESSRTEQQKLRTQRNAILSVLLVVGIVMVAGLLIRKLFPVSNAETKTRIEPSVVVPVPLW